MTCRVPGHARLRHHESRKEAQLTLAADSEGDIHDYKLFDESKEVEAHEALDIIEKKIH